MYLVVITFSKEVSSQMGTSYLFLALFLPVSILFPNGVDMEPGYGFNVLMNGFQENYIAMTLLSRLLRVRNVSKAHVGCSIYCLDLSCVGMSYLCQITHPVQHSAKFSSI